MGNNSIYPKKIINAASDPGDNFQQSVKETVDKPIVRSDYSYTPFQSLGAWITQALSAVPCHLRMIDVSNANAAIRYLQFFNLTSAASLVSGTTAPTHGSFPIPAGTANNPGAFSKVFGSVGRFVSGGLVVAISTTPAVYTSGATAAEHLVNGELI